MESALWNVTDWLYSGVNASIPSAGGPQCAHYSTLPLRAVESLFGLSVGIGCLVWGYCHLPPFPKVNYVRTDRGGKRALLVLMSFVFGLEIGFKFASKTVIYILNPCHIVTAIQIYLLAGAPSPLLTTLFRFHLSCLNGPVLAMLFPVTNTRLFASEVEVYYLQHGLMLVLPYYMLRLGGAYSIEKFADMSWTIMSYGIVIIYHYTILQGLALVTEVNLNNMLCPAPSDPFAGPYYRFAATVHQWLMAPLVCKVYCAISMHLIVSFGPIPLKPIFYEKGINGKVAPQEHSCSVCLTQGQEHGLNGNLIPSNSPCNNHHDDYHCSTTTALGNGNIPGSSDQNCISKLLKRST